MNKLAGKPYFKGFLQNNLQKTEDKITKYGAHLV